MDALISKREREKRERDIYVCVCDPPNPAVAGERVREATFFKQFENRQFRKQRLALWAAGRGPDPPFTAMVSQCCGTVLGPELCQTKATCRRSKQFGSKDTV